MRSFSRCRAVRCRSGERLILAALLAAGIAFPVSAQPPQPIPPFVVDLRGTIPFYPDDQALAEPRQTSPDLLPTYGWGADIGAHVYPFRWKAMTFGFGASYHLSRGSRTPDVPDDSSAEPGPTVHTRFKALSPQVSFNFGHRMGWSYLSGGIGRSTFRAWRSDLDEEAGEAVKTINYGGGARWFINRRVAFSLDLRFYALNSKAPSSAATGHPRMTFAAATVGLSVR
jgi:hypothetical protein